MPLFEFLCPQCKFTKEVLFFVGEKIVDEIACQCGNIMKRRPGAASYLPKTSNTNSIVHKEENRLGTGNLNASQLPKQRGPKMWKGPGGGKVIGQTPK